MKAIFALTLFISIAFSSESIFYKECNNHAIKELKSVGISKKSTNYDYLVAKRTEHCLNFGLGILLHDAKGKLIKPVHEQHLDSIIQDSKISKNEFNKIVDTMTQGKQLKMSRDLIESMSITSFSKLEFIKSKDCSLDTLKVYGLKLGCPYYYQKDFKVTRPENIYFTQKRQLVIIMSEESKPYTHAVIYITPYTNQIAKIELFTTSLKSKISTLTKEEATKSATNIFNALKNKFGGEVEINKTFGKLETDKYSMWAHFDRDYQFISFTDKALFSKMQKEQKQISISKATNSVLN